MSYWDSLKARPRLINLLVGGILFAVLYGSIWRGLYVMDPHHWGLMLSNAKDMCSLRVPYKDIFIQYGILTTVIHGLAFCGLGRSLVSIVAITALAYTVGLALIYRLGLVLTGEALVALYGLVVCVLIHPVIELPWSNYIAFPFLVFGLIQVIRSPQRLVSLFAGGVFFGLAILSREGLAPALLVLTGLITVFDLIRPTRPRWSHVLGGAVLFSGLLLPIGIFFIYLARHGLLGYWYGLSVTLPGIYATEVFPHMSGIGLVLPLARSILKGVLTLDPRRSLFFVSIVANGVALVLFLVGAKPDYIKRGIAIVAAASLLLLSAALHLPDLFRLATGSAIGVVTLFALLYRRGLEKLFFAFVLGALLATFSRIQAGNESTLFPRNEVLAAAHEVTAPEVFRRQRWEDRYSEYYSNIAADLAELRNGSKCRFKFHYNDTFDAFIAVLSPFEQFQQSPTGHGAFGGGGESFNRLRPEFELSEKLARADDLVVFRQVKSDGPLLPMPNRFVVIKRYRMPPVLWFSAGSDILEILVPEQCVADPAIR